MALKWKDRIDVDKYFRYNQYPKMEDDLIFKCEWLTKLYSKIKWIFGYFSFVSNKTIPQEQDYFSIKNEVERN
jgi:hypothetical protein